MNIPTIKVCGLKDSDNIREIKKLSPNYLGFNFYPKSKRYVSDISIIKEATTHNSTQLNDNTRIKYVGIFVNESISQIIETVKNGLLDVVQLHGDEDPEFCKFLKSELLKTNLNKIKIWKAISVEDIENNQKLNEYTKFCELFLFDTKIKNNGENILFGGTGESFDWSKIKDFNSPFLVSGGIGVENISECYNIFKDNSYFRGFDLNSKIESDIGIKDINLLDKIFKQLNIRDCG